MIRAGWLLCLLLLSSIGCADSNALSTGTSTSTPPASAVPATSTASATVTATLEATEAPTATPEPVVQDLRVTHLRIPGAGIDVSVQGSQAIPDTRPAAPGCPAKAPGGSTWSVPQQGVATPELAYEGLENKAWIFGHSRWGNVPGVLFVLEDLELGDELFVDGVDRTTGEEVAGQRYEVEGIYLSDTATGGRLVVTDGPGEIPDAPTVILQTSARESGAGKQWLLDQEKVLAKATNILEGDMDDPCKYLLLFVIARST